MRVCIYNPKKYPMKKFPTTVYVEAEPDVCDKNAQKRPLILCNIPLSRMTSIIHGVNTTRTGAIHVT